MKKAFSVLLFLVFGLAVLFGQPTSYDTTIKPAFQDFTQEIALTLPYLSTVGLNWNDAFIGGFPHFAAGLSVGFATIPYEAIANLANALGAGSGFESLMGSFAWFGFPLPMWCIDGRLGGFIIPFDLGLKIGFLPEEAQVLMPKDVAFDYLMIGADFRLALLQEPIMDLSLGVAATYLAGSITVFGVTPAQRINIGSEWIEYGEGDLFFNWEAFTLDLKAQVSKNIVIFNFSAGIAATYSLYAQTKGGFTANETGRSSGLDALLANYPELDISNTKFIVSGAANGWSLRVFGGVTFEILIVKLDIVAMYNFLGGTMGATANLRIQL